MPFVGLDIPPGIFRNGTRFQAEGRWYDANLVRWVQGAMQPVGGWQKVQASGSDIDLGEPVHGALPWRANDGRSFLALGTPNKCWAFVEGTLTDITPTGFVTGQDDATSAEGVYGSGGYGTGVYGTGDPTQAQVTEAQTWHFDNFGELLVGVAHSDGKLYSWDLAPANDLSVVDASAPTNNRGVVVTPERFLVALGADDDPRKVAWADQESLTLWAPASTNQAGDFILQGAGEILAGQRARGETLIWTTTDLYTMRFIGGNLIYSFSQVGNNCGLIGRRAFTMVDGGRAFWMGQRGFFMYDGFARPISSDVLDYVFSDINRLQSSKIHAVTFPEFTSVRWYYCSGGSTDIDRYVEYNYAEDHWTIGELNRTAHVARGVFNFPMAADQNGSVYDHERGVSYLDIDGEAVIPFAVTGPYDIGEGDNVVVVRGMVPDEKTLGDLSAKLIFRNYPTDDGRVVGPFNPAQPTDIRASGRQVQLRVDNVIVDQLLLESGDQLLAEDGTPLLWSEFAPSEWRFGRPRFDLVPGEGR